MLPEAKSTDLLYASIQNTCCATSGADVDVFSYPKGKLVGQLSVTQDTMFGLCPDTKGDVFVTAYDTSRSGYSTTIYEYAHGGTTPIKTFADPYAGDACSVDPTTGDLAVANWFTGGSKQSGNVLIYDVSSGKYTTHAYWQIRWYRWCAYDTNGDLYVDGQNGNGVKLAVLRKGRHAFQKIVLSDSSFVPYSLQWNGDSLVVANYETSIGPETLAEVHVSGSKGTIVHRTALRDRGKNYGADAQFLIKGSRVISGGYPAEELFGWNFPQGGFPVQRLGQSQGGYWYGLALSPFAQHAR
jgi:hypothetical protein